MCKLCQSEQRKEYEVRVLTSKPWYWSYKDAYIRCNNRKHKAYKYYGGRGIRFLLTEEDFEYLWNRDRAFEMVDPTIDRKENDGDYTIDNCQFLERVDNIIKSNIERLCK